MRNYCYFTSEQSILTAYQTYFHPVARWICRHFLLSLSKSRNHQRLWWSQFVRNLRFWRFLSRLGCKHFKHNCSDYGYRQRHHPENTKFRCLTRAANICSTDRILRRCYRFGRYSTDFPAEWTPKRSTFRGSISATSDRILRSSRWSYR